MTLKETLRKRTPRLFSILSGTRLLMLRAMVALQKRTLVKKISSFYAGKDQAEVINFLTNHGIQMIPYGYTLSYRNMNVDIIMDSNTGLRYVMVNNRRIYFPAKLNDEWIREAVRVALMEQDERSPHRYLPIRGRDIGGDIAIICGASDCIYTLGIIDKFRKVYLFEADPDWEPVIHATLKGFEGKYEIILSYISDVDGPNSVRLDTFLKGKPGTINYVQADIEGMEINLLRGAAGILQNAQKLDLSLCCYHTLEQEQELTSFLTGMGYEVTTTQGYLLLWMQYPLKPPFLRRGVIYGRRMV